jgi:uncharacterized protein YutD
MPHTDKYQEIIGDWTYDVCALKSLAVSDFRKFKIHGFYCVECAAVIVL